MKDTEFYSRLLGISSPWYVKRVELDEQQNRVDIYLDHTKGISLPCPICDKYSPLYDHQEERAIRHLNTCQLETYIYVRMPRIECGEHGIKQIISDWSGPKSTMTFALESHLLDLEKECSLEAVSRLTGVSWDQCWRVMDRAVQRGLARKGKDLPRRLGVDEKSFAKGHKYETIVVNLDTRNLEYVGDDRSQESLSSYYRQFSLEERNGLEAIAMDMWNPFIAATRAYIPGAEEKIVFDKFHVMQVLHKAVDKVRKAESKELVAEDFDILKGTKYLWLWDKNNVPGSRRWEYDLLRKANLKTSRAWAIKEQFKYFWDYAYEGCAIKFFKKWYHWASHSRLEPVKKAAKTIKNHFRNILTYLKHKITNALSEAINKHIEKVKRVACGYRNREHYRTAIYFHCGGLDLSPGKI